jgi:hypothetical protein
LSVDFGGEQSRCYRGAGVSMSPEWADGVERLANLPAQRPALIGRDEALAAVRRSFFEITM